MACLIYSLCMVSLSSLQTKKKSIMRRAARWFFRLTDLGCIGMQDNPIKYKHEHEPHTYIYIGTNNTPITNTSDTACIITKARSTKHESKGTNKEAIMY